MDVLRPKVGVGVIVWRDGEVLLQERIGAHGANTWSFPGGHLEFGEDICACAARETREEMGVEIKNPRIVAVTNDISPSEQKHYITIFVLAEHASGEACVMEPDRARRVGWHAFDDMPRPLFLPIENLLAQGFHPMGKPLVHVAKMSESVSLQ